MDHREKFALKNLTDLLRQGHDPETARAFLTDDIGMDPALVSRAFDLYEDIAKGVREMREPRVLYDGTRVPQPWYTGPSPDDVFWPALERHLTSKPLWNGTPLEMLDRSSSKVVAYLDPPYAKEIRTRGLVVGHVQSGKTTNFTAVISKAADAGYRLFIVLSGIHNNLRRQTQLRLDEQLTDLNRDLWVPLTTVECDFGTPIKATPLLAQPALRLLAVVKKNTKRLNNLISWLEGADDGVLARCPVLVIDDEADQASPNSKGAADERATINQLIIRLLSFPRVAYVGYTATPFANFFIDPKFPEDLYPRHFIVDLPRSPDYFGPESIFGREPTTPDEPEPETLDMIREVDDKELAFLVPPPDKGVPFTPEVTPSLRAALRWFLLAATARRIRDGEPRHTTMLIHTSELVAVHEQLWQPVVDEIIRLDRALETGDAATVQALREQWTAESARVDCTRWNHKPIPAEEVVAGLRDTIALLGQLTDRTAEDCGVVIDNSFSPRRLIYDDARPVPVVVIGGNTLSRGLTLEGLVASFFVRRVGTYDTLLQMGRWFGYRRGYEDLPRMWVTPVLSTQFRFLARVEEQIREEIRRYEEEGLTPVDVPVRVQWNPALGLAVTSPGKMRATEDLKVSYSGQRPQTILFRTDPDWLQRNLEAARRLVREARQAGCDADDRGNRIVFRDVPVDVIARFFDEKDGYQFHENNAELRTDTLVGYIKAQNRFGELKTWNVVIVSRMDDPFGSIDLGVDRPVNLIARSKLRHDSTTKMVNIGILTNRIDWVADLDVRNPENMTIGQLRQARTDSERAVLLIYPIARNSPVRTSRATSGNNKVPLDVAVDIIGVALAFPRAKVNPTPQSYKVVKMPPLPATDLAPEKIAELEDAEAAEQDEVFIQALKADDGEGSLDLAEGP